jgi:hypothetical protein
MKLKNYNLVLDEETQGVTAVSFVSHPAVETEWLLFNKQTINFQIANEEKREALGVIMVADTPIFRRNEIKGEHFVTFSKDLIRNMSKLYFKGKRTDNVTLDHLYSTEGVYLIESWITNKELGLSSPFNVSEGSWIGRFSIENEEVWQQAKSGDFTGFSIEVQLKYGEEINELTLSKEYIYNVEFEDIEWYTDLYHLIRKLTK